MTDTITTPTLGDNLRDLAAWCDRHPEFDTSIGSSVSRHCLDLASFTNAIEALSELGEVAMTWPDQSASRFGIVTAVTALRPLNVRAFASAASVADRVETTETVTSEVATVEWKLRTEVPA